MPPAVTHLSSQTTTGYHSANGMSTHFPGSLASTEDLPASPGTYALIFRLRESISLQIGALGRQELPDGICIYVGSAHGPGGLRARVRRHLRPEKQAHWHIDYLTAILLPAGVIWDAGTEKRECAWTQRLLTDTGAIAPISAFGSSDCTAGCPAHLVRLPAMEDLARVRAVLLRADEKE
jgi:Uri superfamily endonuclease